MWQRQIEAWRVSSVDSNYRDRMRSDLITLRPVNESDIEVFYTHQLDPVSTDLAKVHARSRESFDAHWDAILNDPNTIARTILFDDRVVGLINTFPVKDERHIG